MELIIDSETKVCNKCLKEFPANEENFYKQVHHTKKKGSYYKLSSWCRQCIINKNKKYRVDNLEEVKAYDKFRYRKKEEYYINKAKRWNTENEARKKENFKQWQTDNKEKISEYNEYRRMNKEHDITDQEWLDCLEYFKDSCAYCGLTEAEALNLYNQLLHKEHVDHNGANDITNCIPACKACNSSKHTTPFNEWYNENNSIYSKRRYNKIIKWLLSFTTIK